MKYLGFVLFFWALNQLCEASSFCEGPHNVVSHPSCKKNKPSPELAQMMSPLDGYPGSVDSFGTTDPSIEMANEMDVVETTIMDPATATTTATDDTTMEVPEIEPVMEPTTVTDNPVTANPTPNPGMTTGTAADTDAPTQQPTQFYDCHCRNIHSNHWGDVCTIEFTLWTSDGYREFGRIPTESHYENANMEGHCADSAACQRLFRNGRAHFREQTYGTLCNNELYLEVPEEDIELEENELCDTCAVNHRWDPSEEFEAESAFFAVWFNLLYSQAREATRDSEVPVRNLFPTTQVTLVNGRRDTERNIRYHFYQLLVALSGYEDPWFAVAALLTPIPQITPLLMLDPDVHIRWNASATPFLGNSAMGRIFLEACGGANLIERGCFTRGDRARYFAQVGSDFLDRVAAHRGTDIVELMLLYAGSFDGKTFDIGETRHIVRGYGWIPTERAAILFENKTTHYETNQRAAQLSRWVAYRDIPGTEIASFFSNPIDAFYDHMAQIYYDNRTAMDMIPIFNGVWSLADRWAAYSEGGQNPWEQLPQFLNESVPDIAFLVLDYMMIARPLPGNISAARRLFSEALLDLRAEWAILRRLRMPFARRAWAFRQILQNFVRRMVSPCNQLHWSLTAANEVNVLQSTLKRVLPHLSEAQIAERVTDYIRWARRMRGELSRGIVAGRVRTLMERYRLPDSVRQGLIEVFEAAGRTARLSDEVLMARHFNRTTQPIPITQPEVGALDPQNYAALPIREEYRQTQRLLVQNRNPQPLIDFMRWAQGQTTEILESDIRTYFRGRLSSEILSQRETMSSLRTTAQIAQEGQSTLLSRMVSGNGLGRFPISYAAGTDSTLRPFDVIAMLGDDSARAYLPFSDGGAFRGIRIFNREVVRENPIMFIVHSRGTVRYRGVDIFLTDSQIASIVLSSHSGSRPIIFASCRSAAEGSNGALLRTLEELTTQGRVGTRVYAPQGVVTLTDARPSAEFRHHHIAALRITQNQSGNLRWVEYTVTETGFETRLLQLGDL